MPVAVASGTVTVNGLGNAQVAVLGTAPGIIPAAWSIAASDSGATINSFPAAPVAPNWYIEIIEDVVVVYDFPRIPVQASPTINVDVTGSALGRTQIAGRRVAEAFESANGGTLIRR